MRGIVLGLLLANLLYLGWQFLLPEAVLRVEEVPSLPASDGGMSIDLLSEIDQDQLLRYPAATVPVPNADPSVEKSLVSPAGFCAEIGPFLDVQDAEGFMTTNAERFAMNQEIRQVPAPSVYRVFLPPLTSRELANSTMEMLRTAFVANNMQIDSFLITQGELANGIALGLFAEHRNALNVQNQLQNLGYSVILREESRSNEEIWVLVSGVESEAIFMQHWAEIQLSRSYIRAGEKLC